VLSEYLDDAICCLLDFLGISVLFTQTPSPNTKGRQMAAFREASIIVSLGKRHFAS
jgi:hypothetical protein